MSDDLDWALVLTSLEFTRTAFENYAYPSYEMKCEQMDRVNEAMRRVRAMRDASPRT